MILKHSKDYRIFALYHWIIAVYYWSKPHALLTHRIIFHLFFMAVWMIILTGSHMIVEMENINAISVGLHCFLTIYTYIFVCFIKSVLVCVCVYMSKHPCVNMDSCAWHTWRPQIKVKCWFSPSTLTETGSLTVHHCVYKSSLPVRVSGFSHFYLASHYRDCREYRSILQCPALQLFPDLNSCLPPFVTSTLYWAVLLAVLLPILNRSC